MAAQTQHPQKRQKGSASTAEESKHQHGTELNLQNLKFEKKNEGLKKLPPGTTIRRRPMQHAPIASPYAGSSVPKVVYVSSSTPIMAAVSRVRKLLLQVEKRAMKNVGLVDGPGRDREKLNKIAEGAKQAKQEKIYVKATGRAMDQALKVGQWFKEKEKELLVDVDVKTGSVIVVDDIVEEQGDINSNATGDEKADSAMDVDEKGGSAIEPLQVQQASNKSKSDDETKSNSKPSRRKKKRATYDQDDVPEARTRWVKMVEIAISLKG